MPYPQAPQQMAAPAPIAPAVASSGMGMKLIIVAVIVAIGSTGFIAYNQGWVGSGTPSEAQVSDSEEYTETVIEESETQLTAHTEGIGWAVGSYNRGAIISGVIFNTKDKGMSWELSHESDSALQGVDFINDKKGWVVGSKGLILHTNDGVTWEQQTSGTDKTLYDVEFVNDNRGWAVGASGVIMYTINGGETWVEQIIGLDVDFKKIEFVNENTGWIISDKKRHIVHTTNGRDWQEIPFPANIRGYLYSIDFINTKVGWIGTHAGGDLLYSIDGGKSWEERSGSGAMIDMDFINENEGWVLSDAVTYNPFVHTTNGGKTFEHQAEEELQSIKYKCMDAISSTELWLVSGEKETLYSSDGGETWTNSSFKMTDIVSDWKAISKQDYFLNILDCDFIGDQEQDFED